MVRSDSLGGAMAMPEPALVRLKPDITWSPHGNGPAKAGRHMVTDHGYYAPRAAETTSCTKRSLSIAGVDHTNG